MGTPEHIGAGRAIGLATDSPDQTMAMAAQFGRLCRPNDVVGLVGTLGAGKTCFVRGMALGLAVEDRRAVISPTFVLLRQHPGRLTLHHFDAYRLEGARQMEEIGCQEVFESGGVSVVEWADHVGECLPQERFTVGIRVAGFSRREFSLQAVGDGPLGRWAEACRALAPWRA